MLLPPKRKRQRSGILRAPERVFPRHRRYVRSFVCAVPGCGMPSVCCHLRTAANSGMGLKPQDGNCVPLCNGHHAEQEGRIATFQRKYGVDLWALAERLAQTSPDWQIRKAWKEAHGSI